MISRLDAYQAIDGILEHIDQDASLYLEDNFIERMEALDILELQLVDGFAAMENGYEAFIQRNEVLRLKLEDANARLFTRLLECIRAGDRVTLIKFFENVAQRLDTQTNDDFVGYDELDMLANGILEIPLAPTEPDSRAAEMMFYQPTPVRLILKLIQELRPKSDDVFYDLGSGIGHVPILFSLFSDVRCKGIELEESYVRYSDDCLKKLGLPNIEFIQTDARDANYDDGTIFYLYTPFRGEVLRQVLMRLEEQAKRRSIRVCAFGPCTVQVSKAKWLQPIFEMAKSESHFVIFRSL